MAMFPFMFDDSDWDKDVEEQLRQSMNDVEDHLCATGTPTGDDNDSTCPRVHARSQFDRVRPDQQVVQSHKAIAEEWRPSELRLAVIGRQQGAGPGNDSAGGDVVDVRGDLRQEEVISEHEDEYIWNNKIFECLRGAHPAMTEAFVSKVTPEDPLHPKLQQEAARAVMTAIWPDVVHCLQSEGAVEAQGPEASSGPCEPPLTAFHAPECRADGDGCSSPACTVPQPVMNQPGHVGAAAAIPPSPQCDREATGQSQGNQHKESQASQQLSKPTSQGGTNAVEAGLQRLFLHPDSAPSAQQNTDPAVGTGDARTAGHSRFRTPGDAIRSQSVTPGRPKWQRWIGVQARLALADTGPAAAASDAGAPLAPKRSYSTPRSLSHSDSQPDHASPSTALAVAGSPPTASSAPSKHTLLLRPRGSSEDSGPRRIGAHAAENPSPRRPAGSAAVEGCAEGRLGGGHVGTDNARCGVIVAGMTPTYGRGPPLKTHGCAGIWKNDQSLFRTLAASTCDPAHTQIRSAQLPRTPPQQRTPHASPREVAKAATGENLIGTVARGNPPPTACAAQHMIPTAPDAPRTASPRDVVAAEAARRSQALREEFRKSLQSLQVPLMSGWDSSGEMSALQTTPR
eukprot:jgi/Ulvmu1/834/UM010_0208.1